MQIGGEHMMIDELIRRVNDILKESDVEFEAEYKKVHKNNIELDAIMFTPLKVSPIMYINVEDIVHEDPKDLANRFIDFVRSNQMPYDVSKYFTKDYILSHVYPNVIGDSNMDWIKENDIYHETLLDMIVTFFVDVGSDAKFTSSFTIRNSYIEACGITPSDIKRSAKLNFKEKWKLMTMREIIKHYTGDDPGDLLPMYVLTTKSMAYGAAAIWITSILDEVMESIDEAYVIFPSSIHELVIVPSCFCEDVASSYEMVREINESTVSPIDRLTDSVYFYDGKLKKL